MTYRWVVDDLLHVAAVTFFLSRRRRTEMESGHNRERRLSYLDCLYNTNNVFNHWVKRLEFNSWKVGNRPMFPKQIVMVHASGVG